MYIYICTYTDLQIMQYVHCRLKQSERHYSQQQPFILKRLMSKHIELSVLCV